MKIFKAHRMYVAGFAVLLAAAGAGLLLRGCAPREFAGVDDFRGWARSRGLVVWPDAPAFAVHVSDDPEVRRKLDEDPATLPPLLSVTAADAVGELPAGAACERWGDVVAYGEPGLLARVSALR